MRCLINLKMTCLALVCGLALSSAFAGEDPSDQEQVSHQMTRKDLPIIMQTLNTVMSEYKKGSSLIWQNHATGHYGEITPTSALNSRCRTYDRTWVFAGGVDFYRGRACLNNDVWKPVSESKLRREPLNANNDPLLIASRQAKADRETEAAIQRELALEKLKQQKLLEDRLAIERQQALLKANQKAKVAAAKKEAQIKAQETARRLQERLERQRRSEILKAVSIALGILALIIFSFLRWQRFLKSPYWLERQGLKELFNDNAPYKAIYFYYQKTTTLKFEKSFDLLGSLCIYEDKLSTLNKTLLDYLNQSNPDRSETHRQTCAISEMLERLGVLSQALIDCPLYTRLGFKSRTHKAWASQQASLVQRIQSQFKSPIHVLSLQSNIQQLEPELQNRRKFIANMTLDDHLKSAMDRSDEWVRVNSKHKPNLETLVNALTQNLAKTTLPPVSELSDVPEDLFRINQIKTIIDLYNQKLADVDNDASIDEEEREDNLDYMKRLRERDIAMLEGEA